MDIRVKKLLESPELQEAWKKAITAVEGVPEGIYTFQLQSATLRISEKTGKLYILREHLIVKGEHEGLVVKDMLTLSTPRGPAVVSEWIAQMGFTPPSTTDKLADVIEAISIAMPIYIGRLRRSGEFVNIHIRQVLSKCGENVKGEG